MTTQYDPNHPHRGHIEARVKDPMVADGRVIMLRPNPEGSGEGQCVVCEKEWKFDPPLSYADLEIEEIACMGGCAKEAGFYRSRRFISPPQEVHSPGYQNVGARPTIEATPIPQPSRTPCKRCGGAPNRMAGWHHVDVDGRPCPLSSKGRALIQREQIQARKESRTPCPGCGGPPGKAKGWQHQKVNGQPCPNSTEGKLLAKSLGVQKSRAERPPCPECGGIPGRSKGWQHNAGCSLDSSVKSTSGGDRGRPRKLPPGLD